MLSYKILITIFITFQIAYSQIILDNDNFDQEIKKGVTFVSFISPDSQNWQQLSRTWEELAEIKMEGAKIAIVDCRKDGAQGPNRKLCVRNAVSIFTFFREINFTKNFVKVVSRKIMNFEFSISFSCLSGPFISNIEYLQRWIKN